MRVRLLSAGVDGTVVGTGVEPPGDHTEVERSYYVIEWDDGRVSNEWCTSPDLVIL